MIYYDELSEAIYGRFISFSFYMILALIALVVLLFILPKWGMR